VHVLHCQAHTPYCYTGLANGIDYGVPTGEPILAAGDGSVTFANWGDNNHLDDGYGLSVVISHTNTNGYYTQYSHLSSASVDWENPVQVGETIGTSGGTGVASRCGSYRNANCYGAHLHFSVYKDGVSGDNVVNPYGWYTTTDSTVQTDPWSKTSYNLWEHFPSVTNTDVYTDHNDDPLTKPQPPSPNDPGVVVVDNDEVVVVDADGNIQDPPGCWTLRDGVGYSGSTLSTDALIDGTSVTCRARWPISQTEGAAGVYEVYAYIPSSHATTNGGAIYRIHHDGQIHQAIVVQAAFPNPEPDDNWVYLGKYHFVRDGSTGEYVELGNVTLDNNLNLSFEVAADAVMFVPLGDIPPTPTPTITPTVTPTTTPTPTPTPCDDADHDCIPDEVECPPDDPLRDTDGDGSPDCLDIDTFEVGFVEDLFLLRGTQEESAAANIVDLAGHPLGVIVDSDTLVESLVGGEAQLVGQVGLTEKNEREQGSGIHLVIEQETELVEDIRG